MLNDEDVIARLAAAEAMWSIEKDAKGILPILMKLLEDEDEFVRLEAARALWTVDKNARPVVAAIERILEYLDKNPQVILEGEIEGVNAPVSRRSKLIANCAWLIKRVGPPAQAVEGRLLDVKLVSYPHGRDTVFQAIGAIGPKATRSIPFLVTAVEEEKNLHAALALWRITGDTTRTMQCLLGALEESSTRDFSARAIWGKPGGPDFSMLKRKFQTREAQREALACLAEMGHQAREAMPAVKKAFRSAKDMSDRFNAAESLVKLGDASDELFSFLTEVAEEEEAGIYVYSACHLLAEMESRYSDAIPILKAALEDDDERIVKAAHDALQEIERRMKRQ